MRTFVHKQTPAQLTKFAASPRHHRTYSAQNHSVHPILQLRHTVANPARPRLPRAASEDREASSTTAASTRFMYDFSQIPLYPEAHASAQVEEMVSPPRDMHELEADRVADHLKRMSAAPSQPADAPYHNDSEGQRGQCSVGHKGSRSLLSGVGNVKTTDGSPAVDEVLNSPGEPLDAATRAFMEPRFGHDFARVRVHTDARAIASARALNASAYTVAPSIVFGAGQFAPETDTGRRLLAHELAHIVQQSRHDFSGTVIQRSALSVPSLLLLLEGDQPRDELRHLAPEVVARLHEMIGEPSDATDRVTSATSVPVEDPAAIFTGSGATGIRPGEVGVPLRDQLRLLLEHEGWLEEGATTHRYSNPLKDAPSGDEPEGFRQVLDFSKIPSMTERMVSQPISTVFGQAYGGDLPSRAQVVRAAADAYDLHPELVATFILMEQIDQTQLEDAAEYAAAMRGFDTSIGLGQVLVSTAQKYDLFSGLVSQHAPSRSAVVELLASDETNIFATANYMRIVADQAVEKAAELRSQFAPSIYESTFPGFDPAAYAENSRSWPNANIRALASEYTSTPWDGKVKSGWGHNVLVIHDYIQKAGLF